MNRESIGKLKLDQRLRNRRGWIAQEELEDALEKLPDAGSKATRLGDQAADDGDKPEPPGAPG